MTLAVFLLGGDSQRIDTEDTAIKANELAPRRFTWRKYPDQINIETVRKRLWDARKPEKGGYLVGSDKAGWSLTQAGLSFARSNESVLAKANLGRKPLNTKERNRLRRERERMLGSEAYQKFSVGERDRISIQEAQVVNDNYSSMSATIKNHCVTGLVFSHVTGPFVVPNPSNPAPSV